jgi:hypothetical protein
LEEVAKSVLAPHPLLREIRSKGTYDNSNVKEEFDRHRGAHFKKPGRGLDSYVRPAPAAGVNNMRAVAPF